MKNKIDLESDFKELIMKHKDKLPSGDIVESIIGVITCLCCSALKESKDFKPVKTFIYKVVDKNIKECRKQLNLKDSD